MNYPEIDGILSHRDEIQPSSGFAASVMEAVRREAAAPPPIAFPWKRALPGLVVAVLVLASVVVAGIAAIVLASRGALSLHLATTPAPSIWQGVEGSAIAWIGLSLLTALVSVKLSMRLG